MAAVPFILASLLALAPAQGPEPPQLTTEQRARLSRVAHEGQAETARLRVLLEQRQQDLARVYGEYELDEKRATVLEGEILDLQRQLFASYRHLQVELRATVGRESFMALKKRLDNFLQPPTAKPASREQRP
jgi:hypothetical protein